MMAALQWLKANYQNKEFFKKKLPQIFKSTETQHKPSP